MLLTKLPRILSAVLLTQFLLNTSFVNAQQKSVKLTHGTDDSAGGGPAYIITTDITTYYLEKEGGGLSSILDRDGIDWLSFHKQEGSGWKGEYRGFPNAVHKQDGSYFHAMNAGTDPSESVVKIESDDHVQIVFTSANKQWEGRWDFYEDRCDFTMTKVSQGYKYWVLYEGVPNGEMNDTDFWYASIDDKKHLINEPFDGDFPAPEWIAFGDENSPRMLYVLNHQDDDAIDEYVSRPYMTVLGFGRSGKNKFLTKPKTFSIGFVESTKYDNIVETIERILD